MSARAGRRGRVEITAGRTRVLRPEGVFLVVEVGHAGAVLRSVTDTLVTVPWHELVEVRLFADGHPQAVHEALLPRWETLSQDAQAVVQSRLEVVLEILTGFRRGFAALAVEGEPRPVFGDGRSLSARCASMARQLDLEQGVDRARQRRVVAGELSDRPVGASTIRRWVKEYQRDGVWGLVDKRATRETAGFDTLDAEFVRLARAEFARFDGDISEVNIQEVLRRVLVEAKAIGVDLSGVPQRRGQQFLSSLKADIGRGTRAHRSRSMRDTAGFEHYAAVRPGQIVAIDATRADVLVWDDLHERSLSVEVITALDVATRCVLALRVVPKSATAIDASLLLYDVMRPFSMLVDGTTVSDWRWAGLPDSVTFTCDHTALDEATDHDASSDGRTAGGSSAAGALQGEHRIPSLVPDAIRCDHGAIFVSARFRMLLNDLGIDLLLSRGTRPTDNSHIERWHHTLQAVVQQIAGYKGRNPFERGRTVGRTGTDRGEPLITAAELERQLRAWVALEYHRSWHEGLSVAGAPRARLTPLELFDAYRQLTGRIDVPQRPDLIYQFLPVKFWTIQHDGVEVKNLTYDDAVLDPFRNLEVGAFRARDRAAPFFYDPRDVTRIWFRHPETGAVHPIPWRGAWRCEAPLNAKLLDVVRGTIRARGGNTALGKRTASHQIVAELTELSKTSPPQADRALWTAARLQYDASRRDHFEAQLAEYAAEQASSGVTQAPVIQDPIWDAPTPEMERPSTENVTVLATAWQSLRAAAQQSPSPPATDGDAEPGPPPQTVGR